MLLKNPHRHRSFLKRGLWSLLIITSLMLIGTIGLHVIEDYTYLDAFYFMTMIATAQGPMTIPKTVAGKIFISFMAFISVGTTVASLGYLFGPFFGQLWKLGVDHFEELRHPSTKND